MRCGIVDGRVGSLGLRVTANRATTFNFTFTSSDPLTFTTASLWLGGDQPGGNLAGATEYPMTVTVTGAAAMITLPAFPDEMYAPLRMTLDDVVVSVGGFWVDPDGSCASTRHVDILARSVNVHVTVLGGGGGGSSTGGIIPFDAGGNAAAARPDVLATTIVLWVNVPSEPVNLGPFDMWEDVP